MRTFHAERAGYGAGDLVPDGAPRLPSLPCAIVTLACHTHIVVQPVVKRSDKAAGVADAHRFDDGHARKRPSNAASQQAIFDLYFTLTALAFEVFPCGPTAEFHRHL